MPDPTPKALARIAEEMDAGSSTEKLVATYGYKPDVLQKIYNYVKTGEGSDDPVIKKLSGPIAPEKTKIQAVSEAYHQFRTNNPGTRFNEKAVEIAKQMGAKGEKYSMSDKVPDNLKNLTCIGGVCLVQQRAGNKFAPMKGVTRKNKAYEKEGIGETIEYNPYFWDNADKLGYQVFDVDDMTNLKKGDIVGKYGKAFDGQERMMHSNIILQDGQKGTIEEGQDIEAWDSYQATNTGKSIVKYPYRPGEKNGVPVKYKVARIKPERAAEIEGEESTKKWKEITDNYTANVLPVLKEAPPELMAALQSHAEYMASGNKESAARAEEKIKAMLKNKPSLYKKLFD